LEDFLEEEEFMRIFSMTLEDFAKLPLWKRQNIKTLLNPTFCFIIIICWSLSVLKFVV